MSVSVLQGHSLTLDFFKLIITLWGKHVEVLLKCSLHSPGHVSALIILNERGILC